MHQAMASVSRVRDTLAIAAEPRAAGHTLPVARVAGEITFDGVSFTYDGRPVLQDVTFTAHAGQTVALVGPSGAGKTTLVSLIPRFYEPTRGRVLIDGFDVATIRLTDVREQIAVVLQDSFLMSGTIAGNLLYGRLDATWEQVLQAAHDAHAHEFILELPEGYATELGSSGTTLSGGQRQRISMARAFLKDAPVLILDEATSALDAISARLVAGALTRLREGRTTFVIAHNLDTVRDADVILVMDRGRIVAQGRHDELLSASPLYAELAREMHDDGEARA
jgi:ABC-type multidrug transport system fused ATPase/permease subunit